MYPTVPAMAGKRKSDGDHYEFGPEQKRRCIRATYTIADYPKQGQKPMPQSATPSLSSTYNTPERHQANVPVSKLQAFGEQGIPRYDPNSDQWLELHLQLALRALERRAPSDRSSRKDAVMSSIDAVRQVLTKLAKGSLNARNELSSTQSTMHPAAPGLAPAAPSTDLGPKSPGTKTSVSVGRSDEIQREGPAVTEPTGGEDAPQGLSCHPWSQPYETRSPSGRKRRRQDFEDIDVIIKRYKLQAEQKAIQKPLHTPSPSAEGSKDDVKIPTPASQGTDIQSASLTTGNKEKHNPGNKASTTGFINDSHPVVKPAILSKISPYFPKRPSPLRGPINVRRDIKSQEVEKDEMKQSSLPVLERYKRFRSHFLEIHERAQQGNATRFQYEQARAWVLEVRRALRGPKEKRSQDQHRRSLNEALGYQDGGILKLLGERINIPATSLTQGRDKLSGNAITNKRPKSKKKSNLRRKVLVKQAKAQAGWDEDAENEEMWYEDLWDEDTEDEDIPQRRPAASAAQRPARFENAHNRVGLLTKKDWQAEEEDGNGTFTMAAGAAGGGALIILTDPNDRFVDTVDHQKFRRKALNLLERYSEVLNLDEDIETHARHLVNRLHPNAENQTTRAQVAMCIITATPYQLRGEGGAMLMVEELRIPRREFLPAMRSSWWASAHSLDHFRNQVLDSAETSLGPPRDTLSNLFGD